jgi:ATP-binding cassette subfamily C protein CydC
MNLLTNLGMWAVLVLAIPLVTAGQIESLSLAVITLIAYASFEAVQPLPLAAQYLEANLRAADQLFAIVDTQPEVRPPLKPQAIPEDKTLAVRELVFSYPDPNRTPRQASIAILQISSIDLSPGKRIAIVGPSGSGKTTLLHLLLRFWDYQAGEITLGGKDVGVFSPAELRSQFGVVSQHTHLFNASLRENLLIAKPEATEAEITQAARSAQIHDLIESLPDGYQTLIGEQGLRLSGGERQRIAIARALLKDAPILLLDEPIANLDPLTEMDVLESIHDLMAARSTLLATHRLVGMEWMDEILVLKDGRIIERGRHAELRVQGGFYQRMWDLQNQVVNR